MRVLCSKKLKRKSLANSGFGEATTGVVRWGVGCRAKLLGYKCNKISKIEN